MKTTLNLKKNQTLLLYYSQREEDEGRIGYSIQTMDEKGEEWSWLRRC